MSKICPKCNNNVWDDKANFCNVCGYSFEQSNIDNKNVKSKINSSSKLSEYDKVLGISNNDLNINSNQNNTKQIADKKVIICKIAGIVIGIVSIILSFVFCWIMIIPAVIGIILSLLVGKKARIALILNIAAIVLSLCTTTFYYLLILKTNSFYTGEYKCSRFSTNENDLEFAIDLKLGKVKYFEMKYNKPYDKIHILGTYKLEDLGQYEHINKKTCEITVHTNYREIDGKVLEDEYETKYSITLDEGSNEAVLVNSATYNTLFCKKIK